MVTRAKKSVLIVGCLILLSQIPFAYRRYKLGRLNAAIQSVNSSRRSSSNVDESAAFVEYQGVIHVHSFLGGHSTGTFQEIISAAQSNRLQFVIMTEHVETQIDTSAMTLKGIHGGVLFVNGNEVSTKTEDRLLEIPGDASLGVADKASNSEVLAGARTRGALSIIAYPDEFKGWENSYDGIEVYNVFTNSKRINRFVAFFDAIWSHRSYSSLVFASYLQRPTDSLKKWDELLSHNKLVAVAGNDSHSNVGISLNDRTGNELVGLQLDPYEMSFHLVRVHVLIPRGKGLDVNSLIEAVRGGHCFIGFDLLGDTSGFRFDVHNSSGTRIQGDEIPFRNETYLKVTLPVSGRVVIFQNGGVVLDEVGVTSKEFKVTERGVYRVEAYLPQLGQSLGEQSWIISNPIYVK